MGWDDDRREDPILEWDYLDYMNILLSNLALLCELFTTSCYVC